MTPVVAREIVEDLWVVDLGRRPLDTNVYLVRSGGGWVLVDTGWPGNAREVRRAAEAVFGRGARPEAILITHLHLDHSGSLRDLAAAWEAPAFVHPRELPLAGGYVPEFANPLDRRVILPLLGLLPRRSRERILTGGSVTDIVRALDPAAPPPGLPDWSCVPAPGHTPGSVAFFRPRDGVLVTGDALLTVDLRTLRGLVRARPQLAPPLGFTDWDRSETVRTIGELARLVPRTVAPGHGNPRSGPSVPHDLQALADRLQASPENAGT